MNAAHLHLLVNHAGLFAALFGGVILAVGMFRNQPTLVRAGLVLSIFAGLSAIVSVQTGERAESIVENLPAVSMDAVEEHEEFAELAQAASIVLALVAAAALALAKRPSPTASRVAVIATLFVSAVVFGLTALTANLGGRIRHAEITTTPTVVAPSHAEAAVPGVH